MQPSGNPFEPQSVDPFGTPRMNARAAKRGLVRARPRMGAPYGAPPSADYNTFAVLSPIFAVVVPPAGVVLGHLALPQIRRSGERGRNAAIAGLVIGYLMCLVLIAALIWWLMSDSDSGDATASPSPSTTPYQMPPPRPSTVTSVAPPPPFRGSSSTSPRCRSAPVRSSCATTKATTRWICSRSTARTRRTPSPRGSRQLRMPFRLRRRAARPLLRPVPEPVLMPMNILEATTHRRRPG